MNSLVPRAAVAILLIAVAAPVVAQPSLSSLWPADAGRVWEFDIRVEGPLDEVQTGVVIQTVAGQAELAPGITITCFDVESTVARPVLLLAVSECVFDVGLRVDDGVALGTWNDPLGDWSWWWIGDSAAPGSTFRLPIRTNIQDDAFVNGEVRTDRGVVTTPAASFTDAVIVDYVVELGESTVAGESGDPLGTVVFEVTGWVAFVPDVGPVASEETLAPAQIDCPDCPVEILESVTTTLDLRAAIPVEVENSSFGVLKARY